MTNEQLAELIGQGGNDELLPLLWEKTKRLYRMWADKYYTAHKERCDLCGVTADDIRQESYLSMLEAVKAYTSRTEEHNETPFICFCKFPFKTHAAELIGARTKQGQGEPLNRFRGSLDEPLSDKDGKTDDTLANLIPDPEAEQPYRDIEQADYSRSIREAVSHVLEEKPKELEVIERRYYGSELLGDIAVSMGVSKERIRQMQATALRKLRNSRELKALAEIGYYKHVSVNSFQRTHISAVEKIAEERERRYNEFKRRLEEYRKQAAAPK